MIATHFSIPPGQTILGREDKIVTLLLERRQFLGRRGVPASAEQQVAKVLATDFVPNLGDKGPK